MPNESIPTTVAEELQGYVNDLNEAYSTLKNITTGNDAVKTAMEQISITLNDVKTGVTNNEQLVSLCDRVDNAINQATEITEAIKSSVKNE